MTAIEAFADREVLMEFAAARATSVLRAALDARGRASLAVPGGTTPGPFLKRLSAERLDWTDVTVLPTDERVAPPGSPRLNETLIRAAFLRGPAAAARYRSLAAPPGHPEHALPALVQAVADLLPLDLCVLGMGEDGHTASLFPGADRLATALADDAPPVMLLRAPGAPEPRVTLTAPVLRGAGTILLLLTGAAKRVALDRALREDPEAEAPVRAILARATVLYAP